MKNLTPRCSSYCFIIAFFLSYSLLAQVGIGTTTPSAALDISGDIEISNTPINSTTLTSSSDAIVLVKDLATNQVQITSIKDLYENHIKTLVKASKSSTSQVTLVTAGGSAQKLLFDTVEVDTNSEYVPATSVFTPKQDGWYDIESQISIEPATPLSATISNDFRLNIVKNGSTVVGADRGLLATLVALGTNVYLQPTRRVRSVVYLTTTDTIEFQVQNNNTLIPLGIDINVLGNATGSFFQIKQVR